jgi:hypothetical protein
MFRVHSAGALFRAGVPAAELRPVLFEAREHKLKSVRSAAIAVQKMANE